MIRVALRGVRAHLVRFVLSVLAVTLGVAFVVGSFAFRSVLSATFEDIIATTVVADTYVRGSEPLAQAPAAGGGSVTGFGDPREPVPLSVVDDVAAVDGVARASADASGPVVLVGADGTPVVTTGPPSTALPVYDDDPALTLSGGTWPRGPDEIVLEDSAAATAGLTVGDATQVVLGDAPQDVTVVGTFSIEASAAGAILVGIDEETALATFAPDGVVPTISVFAEDGVGEEELTARVAEVLPSGAEAVTGDEARAEASAGVEQILGFVETFLLVFAAISLVVSTFIIANTFSMSVRERMRELALLRALGASPQQVFRSILTQALVVGVLGAGVGIVAGAGLVRLIQVVLAAQGMEFGGTVRLGSDDITVAVAVGVGVSLAAAAVPARRAATIPPVQAMRDEVAPERQTRVLTVVGTLVLVVGAGLLALASALGRSVDGVGVSFLDDLDPRWLLGLGAAGVLLGALLVSPALARPVLTTLAWPLLPLRPLGRLARGNVTRNPRRTASTAGALMIGMALVSVTGVIAASTQASVRSIVENEVAADYVVDSATLTVPEDAVAAVENVAGVERTDPVRLGGVASDDGDVTLAGVEPGFFSTALDVVVDDGDPDGALDAGEAVVGRIAARERGWAVGDTLTLGREASTQVTVGAVVDSQIVTTDLVLPQSMADDLLPPSQQTVRVVYVTAADGTDLATLRTDLQTAVEPFVVLTVLDSEELASSFADQVTQVLAILYALLALSIVIALLGIVNTLALSIIERTREIGLLRAVGLGRLQLAGVIAIEAVMISLYGTVLGVAVGIAIGAALPGVLADEGLSTLAIPWDQVLGVLGAAVVIGLIASVWPAIRAARLPVLDAVTVD
ncbi:putative ABC transport system permease protein [Paraoerskovia marina]|uniref:Putative ABC transport system permease protein n=1 Tax=Paraoerskovia marina TaxID=545619 RepID=A0A1H1VVI7_9CELL|nr:ABC transporter permease [Paraoerskovia marina]SDS88884.1 putative ABC transport system permease protein [Paraoerskovia marina]